MWVTFLLDDCSFVTAVETITDVAPDSLLAMLIRNELLKSPDATELSIRIDRSPKLFRHILQWYRDGGNCTPKANEIGLTEAAWQQETDFYLIGDEVENISARKRARDTESDFAKKSQAAKKRVDDGMQKEKEAREEIFKNCLEYMMNKIGTALGWSVFTFVGTKSERLFGQSNFPKYLMPWFSEFQKFAALYGWYVERRDYNETTTVQIYSNPPASDRRQPNTSHSDITIYIKKQD